MNLMMFTFLPFMNKMYQTKLKGFDTTIARWTLTNEKKTSINSMEEN